MNIRLFIAIPAMNENDFIASTLRAIEQQQCPYPFTVFVCLNQPDIWWTDPEKEDICVRNQMLLRDLQNTKVFPVRVIDCCSRGKGWQGKHGGVGWARKTLWEHIAREATPEDIFVSMDADTTFSSSYFRTLGDFFVRDTSRNVLSVPYYHACTGKDSLDRAMLRYELYMRDFLHNLYNIHSPYAFTALGSAIAIRMRALQKIGGITPVKSGEDFYLLQKLRKMSFIHSYLPEYVLPATRFSDRVDFGTGPALIKGSRGQWHSYPIYHHSLFKSIADTYALLPKLYRENINTPFLDFLQKQSRKKHLWQLLRENVPDEKHFIHAFHENADGLRILQFVKQQHEILNFSDEKGLYDNSRLFLEKEMPSFFQGETPLENFTTEQLQILRNQWFLKEMKIRQTQDAAQTSA
ncbi:MAG: hypothetical protein LBR51_00170 [Bacteroidales bacterium]|jgi:hypothetical protein|nr:hypothetical protein [Bacteroidales bacterium]